MRWVTQSLSRSFRATLERDAVSRDARVAFESHLNSHAHQLFVHRSVTIVFSDIVKWTNIAAALREPASVALSLNFEERLGDLCSDEDDGESAGKPLLTCAQVRWWRSIVQIEKLET